MLKVTCTGCGAKYKAPEKFAGKKIKCKKCSAAITIGEAAENKDNAASGTAEVLSSEGNLWNPINTGPLVTRFLKRKLPDEPDTQEIIKNQTAEILGLCVPPSEAAQRTVLVVGHVQSGKTLSITSLSAMARDNNFKVIILLSGATKNLTEQSEVRLTEDLDVGRHFAPWIKLVNPDETKKDTVEGEIRRWDTGPEIKRRPFKAILITVLKHYKRIKRVADLFASLGHLDIPTLIIDDEADQASLNNLVKTGEWTATYQSIMKLKGSLPKHTYLQYTATPQAPILLQLIDSLSPDYAKVIDAGPDYVGLRDLFKEDVPHVQVIPPDDIPSDEVPSDTAPKSCIEALRLFVVSSAAALSQVDNLGDEEEYPGWLRNRSMLIHPSHLQADHATYRGWVISIIRQWKTGINSSDQDLQESVFDELRSAHTDLALTVEDLEDFENLKPQILEIIENTQIRVANAAGRFESDQAINWQDSFSWILIGGNKLQRGFTLEGLTTTYMPRPRGAGNIDTIQQRARFLGYKRKYLGYCRIYLEHDVKKDFENIYKAERNLLKALRNHKGSLEDFNRIFLCDNSLKYCRDSVLATPYKRSNFRHGWYLPGRPPEIDTNRNLLEQFLQENEAQFIETERHEEDKSLNHLHRKAIVPLEAIYDTLLSKYQIEDPVNQDKWVITLLSIRNYLDGHGKAGCGFYIMAPEEQRERSLNNDPDSKNFGSIKILHSGAAVKGGRKRPDIYKGDSFARDETTEVTIQLHNLTIKDPEQPKPCQVLAVWMSKEILGDDYISQTQD